MNVPEEELKDVLKWDQEDDRASYHLAEDPSDLHERVGRHTYRAVKSNGKSMVRIGRKRDGGFKLQVVTAII